ncbi:MAG: hypothetical protein Q9227_002969 [Pyrenula ochraceoflavens]
MAIPKSPPIAFQPTPETIPPDSDKENSVPSFNKVNMQHFANLRTSREARFSPPSISPTRRAQSLATSVPLLEPISSASQIPHSLQRSKHTTPSIDFQAYIEQSRSLLKSQQLHFEKERSFFHEERKLWDTERTMLLSQIADLELKLNKASGTTTSKRGTSEDLRPRGSLDSIRTSFSLASSRDGSQDRGSASEHKIWESPDFGGSVTRVFSHESHGPKKPEGHLPSIAEAPTSPPGLVTALSPLEKVSSKDTPISIPIEKIDSSLDGITIKSTSLPPSFVKTIVSPSSPSPLQSPSPLEGQKDDQKLFLDKDKLSLSPYPDNLTKHAGHTPLAVDSFSESSSNSDGKGDKHSPRSTDTEKPYCPEPTARPPTERSNSYFPDAIPIDKDKVDDDPELKGPLTMGQADDATQDDIFLSELDKKLAAEVEKAESPVVQTSSLEGGAAADDEGPKLRIKRSTNFGSAWGSAACGKNV